MGTASLDRLIDLLSTAVHTSAEIRAELGVSQATVSRLVSQAGERLFRIGRGRSTRYAAASPVFDSGAVQPLHAVDERGELEQIGLLRAPRSGGYFVEPRDRTTRPWLLGEAGDGLFESLPYFLYEPLPAGFIGRQIARQLARQWGVPADPRDWNDGHIGRYLLQRGSDLPGNLVVGRQAADEVARHEPRRASPAEYPALADLALGDEVFGSSAAGEQPKFAVHRPDVGHVIVKFSPAGASDEATRWRDLLRAEAHALAALSRLGGVPVAETTVHAGDGRVFLESRRFDRVGERGRRPALSLRMIDAEHVGSGQGWTAVAAALHRRGLLEAGDLDRVAMAETFGGWIGNTDMHLGNVSLAPRDAGGGFALLPLYDMLPMAFAPRRGDLPRVRLGPPIRTPENRACWEMARAAATALWRDVAHDDQISASFRQRARGEAERCAGAG